MGYGRLIGEHASLQLDELYRALHWYVNCLQLRVLLMAEVVEGRTIHRIYDVPKRRCNGYYPLECCPPLCNRNCVLQRMRLTRYGSSSKWNSCSKQPFAVKLIAALSANRHRPRPWSCLISQDAPWSLTYRKQENLLSFPRQTTRSRIWARGHRHRIDFRNGPRFL